MIIEMARYLSVCRLVVVTRSYVSLCRLNGPTSNPTHYYQWRAVDEGDSKGDFTSTCGVGSENTTDCFLRVVWSSLDF